MAGWFGMNETAPGINRDKNSDSAPSPIVGIREKLRQLLTADKDTFDS